MRRDLIIALLAAFTIHAGMATISQYLGNEVASAPKAKRAAVTIELIEMPKLEPDEPEVVDNNQPPPPQNFAPPMLSDVPKMVTDTSFVQDLAPPPPTNIGTDKGALTIPQNTGNWAKGIGEVFDISKLDEIPHVTVQERPQYPFEMHRAGITGSVLVDFIVDTTGEVRNPYAVSSTVQEFESSAVRAVSKWRFRPGKRGGRAVNTHMQVPIEFSLASAR